MSSESPQTFEIEVGSSRTTALSYPVSGAHVRCALVLAHGAGAPQTHPWMVAMARALTARSIRVVTFNFLYTEARRRAPDKPEVLVNTWRCVLDAVRTRDSASLAPLFIGGKSMGGRMATELAARREAGEIAGLVLLGYPLHPPGQPTKLRVAHLGRVERPMLFVQGSRDAFGTPAELEPVLRTLSAGTRLHVVEGGDHSFGVGLRDLRDGRVPPVLERVADEIERFTESR